MILCNWLFQGIGINAGVIEQHLNTERLVRFFSEQCPDDKELPLMLASGDYSKFCLDDYLYGQYFEDLADVLCHCDDTNTLTFATDGDNTSYFYYPPSMPWHRIPNEPKSEQEVISRIVRAVQKIADMTETEITELIDRNLQVVGRCYASQVI